MRTIICECKHRDKCIFFHDNQANISSIWFLIFSYFQKKKLVVVSTVVLNFAAKKWIWFNFLNSVYQLAIRHLRFGHQQFYLAYLVPPSLHFRTSPFLPLIPRIFSDIGPQLNRSFIDSALFIQHSMIPTWFELFSQTKRKQGYHDRQHLQWGRLVLRFGIK